MMPLKRANEIRRELEEEHGFNAEQANGTMMVVDEMVDHGIDRVLKSIAGVESKIDGVESKIAGLESKMDKSIAALDSKIDKTAACLRTELGKDIASLRSEMDTRFKSVDTHFTLIQWLLPFASAVTTIVFLAGLVAIFGDAPNSVKWLMVI